MPTKHNTRADAEAYVKREAAKRAAEKEAAKRAAKKAAAERAAKIAERIGKEYGKRYKNCLKEGCGHILKGKQTKRCSAHHMLCAKRGCKKAIQNHDVGFCNEHGGARGVCRTVAASAKKQKFCLKQGCGVLLTGRQKTRCADHNWMCAKKGCKKNEQASYRGFCKAHFSL